MRKVVIMSQKARGVNDKMATVPRATSATTRGRGRARLLSAAINRPGKDPSTPIDSPAPPKASSTAEKENNAINKAEMLPSTTTSSGSAFPSTAEQDIKQIEVVLLRCFRNPKSDNMKELVTKVESFVKGFEVQNNGISKVVDVLTEAAVEDRDLGIAVGQTVDRLVQSEMMGGKFRSLLLSKIQQLYKKREQLKFNQFLGLTSMLCSIYNYVRVSDQPMKPLTTPVYCLLNEVLEGKSNAADEREQEIETFHESTLMVASVLEECDKEKMTALFNEVRRTILQRASQKMRCLLMECLEYHASAQWKLDEETKSFYTDLFAAIQ